MSDTERITVGETVDGDPVSLPVVDVLTGRGFLTGKSGSGKSNTASVVLEELLDAGFPSLVVDADGEYYGLKEEYELLHVGADEECDIQIGPEHAERIASLALEENVPIILDVSGYLDEDAAGDLVRETARHLFAKEKKLKKPFLLIVEECHEYIPEGGGMDETGKMLIKIGKRGRKHGLGIVGVSQRPADVKKDFITQANWLVWHRLTWENDTQIVKRVVDGEYADRVTDLPDGRAFLQADWTDREVLEVQFRRKHTFDAGATPGLDDFERPELKSVSDDLVGDLADISERKQNEEDRIASLERDLQEREARIEELESELESAQDVSDAARQMAAALTGDADVDRSEYEQRLMEKDREINELNSTVAELRAERDRLEARVEELEAGGGDGASEADASDEASDDRITALERKIEAKTDRIEDVERNLQEKDSRIDELEQALAERAETIADLERTVEGKVETIERLRTRSSSTESSNATASAIDDEKRDASTAGGEKPDHSAADEKPADVGDEEPEEAIGETPIDLEATSEWPSPDDASSEGGRSLPSWESKGDGATDPLDPSRTDAEVLEDTTDPDQTSGGQFDEEGSHDSGAGRRDDATILGTGSGDEEGAATDPARKGGREDDGLEADQETVEEAIDGAESDERGDEDDDRTGEILEDDDRAPHVDVDTASMVDLILADPVTERILMAYREARCNERHTWEIVSALATRAPLTARDVEPHTEAPLENVQSLLGELRKLSLVNRFDDGRWEFDRPTLEALVENPQRVDGLDDPDFAQRID
jgi:uncharacterized coiled-coil protein SlyX